MRAQSWWVLAAGAMTVGCTTPAGDDENVGQAEEASVVCATGGTVLGIDVSYYQSKPNWKAVAGAGMRFAIARINDGSFIDPVFDYDYQGIRDAGLVRGSYQFFRSSHDPIAMADLVIKKVGKLEPGDLAPVLDVEATDGASAPQMVDKIQKWAAHVEQGLGRKPIIYSGRYFWDDNVKSSALKDYPYWIPEYTSDTCPNLAAAWNHWVMWQFTSTNNVAGIAGHVDTNRFNGGELGLQDMAANGYRASIVSLDYPKTLEAGKSGMVALKLKNEGARSWGGKTKLGTSDQRDRKSPFAAPTWDSPSRVVTVEGTVKHGQVATIQFHLVAPAKTGDYLEHFNLVEEGAAWFSDIVPGGGPSDTAIALSIKVVAASGGSGAGGGSSTSTGTSTGTSASASTGAGAGAGAGGNDASGGAIGSGEAPGDPSAAIGEQTAKGSCALVPGDGDGAAGTAGAWLVGVALLGFRARASRARAGRGEASRADRRRAR